MPAEHPEIHLRNDGTPWYDPCLKVALYRKDDTLFAILKTGREDIFLKARWYTYGFMNIEVWIPEAFQKMAVGIFGDYDGDPCNDYIARDGRRLPPENCTWRENDQLIQDHMKSCELILK